MPSFTKQAIKQSFWELLEQRPLNQITVKDIVERCGINRNSFYYHFADIPTLIEEIITEQAERIIASSPSLDSIETCLRTAVEFASQNRRAILHIYHSVNRALYEQYLWQVCQSVVEAYWNNVIGDRVIPEQDKALIQRYYRCLFFGVVIDLVTRDTPAEELNRDLHRFCELRKGSMEEMLQRSLELN